MAFTKALFYPWIDITNEGWLKNAILYWDGIQTIVPSSIGKPYSTRTAEVLCDNGLLEPLYVNPDMPEIKGLGDDVLSYLASPEGNEVLGCHHLLRHENLHLDKLSRDMQYFLIHPDKLGYKLQHIFSYRHWGDWIQADRRFLNYYMTLLATRLAENRGVGILTDTPISDKFANASKLRARHSILGLRRTWGQRHLLNPPWANSYAGIKLPSRMSQGLMANMVLKTLRIFHNTPVEKIIKFRERYSDELALFRNNIAELTSSISDNQPLEALLQQVNDKYVNEFVPRFNELKKALKGSRIKAATENLYKASFISAPTTSVSVILGALTVPQALLAAVGISLTVGAVLYSRERAEKLRQSPFSYLLLAEKSFS
jgi:hypothetical protein